MIDYKITGAGGGGGEVEPDTLFTNAIGKGIYIISEGPIGGLYTGDAKSIYLNDVPCADANGRATAPNGVTWTMRNGLPDQRYIDGFPAAVSYTTVEREVKTQSPYEFTIANGADSYDAAYVVVKVPQLGFQSRKGNLRKAPVGFRIAVKSAGGSWVTQHDVHFVAKSSSEWEGNYRVELPAGGSPWTIRVTRTVANSDEAPKTNGEMYNNETIVSRYATVTDGKFTYPNTAILGIQYDAKTYGGTIPAVKALVNGIMCYVPKNYDPVTRTYATTGPGTSNGIWDGTFKTASTDNPAWIYHDLIVNNRYGLGDDFNPSGDPDSAFIDKWALYSLAQYFDEMVPDGLGGEEPRFTINCQVSEKSEAYDLLQSIISAVNGMIFFSADQLVVVTDRPQEIVDAFTQADVKDGVFSYSGTALKTRHSAVAVRYPDPNNLYKTTTVIYEDPDYIEEIGYRLTEVDAFGCTSRGQALRLAKWTLRTERTQTQTVSFKTGLRGGLLSPGDIIKVFDDYKTGQRTGGRLLQVSKAGGRLNLTLDAPVSVTTSDKIVYLSAEGVFTEVAFDQAFTDTATVSVPDTNPTPIVGGMFGIIFASLDGQEFRVLMIEESEDNEYTVTALQHDRNKFAYVEEGIEIDAPQTSVISVAAPSVVHDFKYNIQYAKLPQTQTKPLLEISWSAPRYPSNYEVTRLRGQIDERIIGYELQLATPDHEYKTVYRGNETTWTSGYLPYSEYFAPSEAALPQNAPEFAMRIRSRDALGRTSEWVEKPAFRIYPPNGPISVSNVSLGQVLNGTVISWSRPTSDDFKSVVIKHNTVVKLEDDPLTTEVDESLLDLTPEEIDLLYRESVAIAEVTDDYYIHNNISDDDYHVYFIEAIGHNPTVEPTPHLLPDDPDYVPPNYTMVIGTRGKLAIGDIPEEAIGIPEVDELPIIDANYTGPSLVFNKADQQLYKIVDGEWVLAIPPASGFETVTALPATGTDGQVVFFEGELWIWNTSQWEKLVPDAYEAGGILSVSTLPATANEGDVVFLTTDGKLYRYFNGQWTAKVSASDLTGQLTDSQIEEIDAAKLVGQIISEQIASVVASKITGTLAAINIPGLDASKIVSGEIDSARIGSIVASKITGTLSAAQIPGLDASKIISGEISGSMIPNGAISALKLASDISAVEIVSALPSSGNYKGRLVFLNTDGKLYRWTSSSTTGTAGWSKAVYADDITGSISGDKIASIVASKITGTLAEAQIPGLDASKIVSGELSGDRLVNGAITAAKLSSNLSAAEIVSALPSSGNYKGRLVFLTTDNKLYRWTSTTTTGTGSWSAAVSAGDISGTITETQISDGAIKTPKLAANAITGEKIAANTIEAGHLVANTITAGQIAAGAIVADLLAANSVVADKIAAGAIVSGKIAAGVITATEIATDAITANKIKAGEVTTAKLAANAVTAAKIAANTITADQIAANTITTGLIASGAITTSLLAAEAVTAAKIAAGVIVAGHIAAGTITSNEIASGTIIAGNIAAGAIVAGKIAAGAVGATEVAAQAITASKLFVGDVTNLVTNGGFESTDLAAWYTSSGATLLTTSGYYPPKGNTSLVLRKSNLSSSVWGAILGAYMFPVTAGEVFDAYMVYRGDVAASVGAYLRLEWYDSNKVNLASPNNYTDAVQNAPITTNWTTRGKKVTAPTGAAFCAIRIYNHSTNTTAQDLIINEIVVRRANAAQLIVDGAIIADHLATNSIIAGKIATNAVTTATIAAEAVTAAKIAVGAIEAGHILAGAITSDAIEAGAITTAKIAADAITADKLAANAVVADNIKAGEVTTAKIATGAINADKIAADAIIADKIKAGAVDATKISVTNLAAINTNLGSITAGSLNIGNKFIVASDGTTTIRSGTTGARLVLTNTQMQVYDANRLRVRIGLW